MDVFASSSVFSTTNTYCSQESITEMPFSFWLSRPKKSGRHNTISVALPASIVENAQGGELKALLVGQMARALTIYGVDEAWKSPKMAVRVFYFL